MTSSPMDDATMNAIELPASPDEPLLLHGDCLDLLAQLPDASVHAVVTDPPAGIGFMGKPWDSFAGYEPRTARGREAAERIGPLLPAWAVGFVAFLTDVWSEVDRVLMPGGWVCAWALPKTADLAGLAGRAVGWDVHDSLLHLFGGGMPKGLNIGKAIDKMAGAERAVMGSKPANYPGSMSRRYQAEQGKRPDGDAWGNEGGPIAITTPATDDARRWDGWNTQLAPGHEQWLLFRKPTRITYAANVLEHCTGALHVDACRIPRGEGVQKSAGAIGHGAVYRESSTGAYQIGTGREYSDGGSWPRNVVLTCGGEECPAEALDRQTGALTSGTGAVRRATADGHQGQVYGATSQPEGTPQVSHGDSGGASRFFTRFENPRPFVERVIYKAKASDRGAGLRSDIVNAHPTHKHVDLMRWLVRLLAATAETTGGEAAIVLDPFAGSFTTGVACVAERVRFIGIERDSGSYEVGRARVLAAIGSPEAAAEANAVAPQGAQMSLL